MDDGTTEWNFTYSADGLRTKRSNGTTTYEYIYNGSSLTQMTVGDDTLYFAYDASGTPMTVTYNGTTYYYVTNIQGDVIGILDGSGNQVASYIYDAWGNILSTDGTMKDTLGQLNPLRYRSYVFDRDTNLYYLQSRYYNPELGRFLNADAFTSTGQGLLGNNMFTYCLNNPVMFSDRTGNRPIWEGNLGGITVYSDTGTRMNPYFEELMVLHGATDYYKGARVYRDALPGGYGFSYGAIFLGKDVGTDIYDANLLRHEYGHYCQLQESGNVEYTIFVLIPSITTMALSEAGIIDVPYYSMPWEFVADLMGGVEGRDYESEVLELAWLYNQAITMHRSIWAFLFGA